MVMSGNNGTAQSDRTRKLRHLRELIAALDRRVPHVERIGEIAIAREGRALREKALQRIAELESEPRGKPDLSHATIPSDNDDVAKRTLARRLGF
jgi:hypothetical protein